MKDARFRELVKSALKDRVALWRELRDLDQVETSVRNAPANDGLELVLKDKRAGGFFVVLIVEHSDTVPELFASLDAACNRMAKAQREFASTTRWPAAEAF